MILESAVYACLPLILHSQWKSYGARGFGGINLEPIHLGRCLGAAAPWWKEEILEKRKREFNYKKFWKGKLSCDFCIVPFFSAASTVYCCHHVDAALPSHPSVHVKPVIRRCRFKLCQEGLNWSSSSIY